MKKYVNKIIQGDCLKIMKTIEDNSIDTIITDPPYNLASIVKRFGKENSAKAKYGKDGSFQRLSKGFMGKEWDNEIAFQKETWEEVLRVAKPGATLLAFGGTRTYHRMTCAIEDAGWIIKDCIMWLYGSGFPKATDISKQIDKKPKANFVTDFKKWLKDQINKSELKQKEINDLCGFTATSYGNYDANDYWYNNLPNKEKWLKMKEILKLSNDWDWIIENNIEARGSINPTGGLHSESINIKYSGKQLSDNPVSNEAKLWNGWKSHGLKPAYEPILVAMKPNEGTYANNALKWGVSGLNIDGGRIPTDKKDPNIRVNPTKSNGLDSTFGIGDIDYARGPDTQGRFPANIILDEEVAKDEEWKRFFYCPKASKSERNFGCEGLEKKDNLDYEIDPEHPYKSGHRNDNNANQLYMGITGKPPTKQQNNHPTVKPLKLMEYLCTITKTPTGGIVLDPFAGSGTTCIAAKKTGRDFIGIEKDESYCEIANKRIKAIPLKLFN